MIKKLKKNKSEQVNIPSDIYDLLTYKDYLKNLHLKIQESNYFNGIYTPEKSLISNDKEKSSSQQNDYIKITEIMENKSKKILKDLKTSSVFGSNISNNNQNIKLINEYEFMEEKTRNKSDKNQFKKIQMDNCSKSNNNYLGLKTDELIKIFEKRKKLLSLKKCTDKTDFEVKYTKLTKLNKMNTCTRYYNSNESSRYAKNVLTYQNSYDQTREKNNNTEIKNRTIQKKNPQKINSIMGTILTQNSRKSKNFSIRNTIFNDNKIGNENNLSSTIRVNKKNKENSKKLTNLLNTCDMSKYYISTEEKIINNRIRQGKDKNYFWNKNKILTSYNSINNSSKKKKHKNNLFPKTLQPKGISKEDNSNKNVHYIDDKQFEKINQNHNTNIIHNYNINNIIKKKKKEKENRKKNTLSYKKKKNQKNQNMNTLSLTKLQNKIKKFISERNGQNLMMKSTNKVNNNSTLEKINTNFIKLKKNNKNKIDNIKVNNKNNDNSIRKNTDILKKQNVSILFDKSLKLRCIDYDKILTFQHKKGYSDKILELNNNNNLFFITK